MDLYQIDRYAFISVYMHVRVYEYSWGRASHSYNKPAVYLPSLGVPEPYENILTLHLSPPPAMSVVAYCTAC